MGLAHAMTEETGSSNFSLKHNLKIMNSFFEKKAQRRWTWIPLSSWAENEIDFVLLDTPAIFTDVSVLNSFSTGSDHRLLRDHIILNTKIERAKRIKKVGKANSQTLTTKKKEFKLLLTNRFKVLSNEIWTPISPVNRQGFVLVSLP